MSRQATNPAVLKVESSNRIARVSYTLALIGALIGVTLIVLIAGALSGVWRTVALAVLAPILVISILALWRAARAVSALSARRQRTLLTMQKRGIVGILARPDIGVWEERVQRNLLLRSGVALWSVGPQEIDSPQGQQRMHDLYVLLGQVQPPHATLGLPARATLALIDDTEPVVTMWDLSAYFERADAGDATALDGLADLEEQTSQRSMDAVAHAVDARRRSG